MKKWKYSSSSKAEQFVLFLNLFVMSLIFILRDMLKIEFPIMLTTFICVVPFIYLNANLTIAYLIFLIPWGIAIQLSAILGIGFLIFLLKNRISLHSSFIIAVILAVYEYMHLVIPPFDFLEYIRYLIAYLIVMIIVFNTRIQYDTILILKAFLWGVFLSAISILLQTLEYFSFSFTRLIMEGVRVGDIKSLTNSSINTLYANSNTLAFWCSAAIAVIFVLKTTNRIRPFTSYLLFFSITIIGILTMSRTFVVIWITTLVLNLIFSFSASKRISRNLLALIITCFLMFLTINIQFPSLIDNVDARFNEKAKFAGRDQIFSDYNNLLLANKEYLVFGTGIQNPHEKLHYEFIPHNSIQEIYVSWGIIGLIITIVLFYYIFKLALKNSIKRYKYLSFIPAISILGFSLSSHFFVEKDMIFLVVVAFMAVKSNSVSTDELPSNAN